MKNSVLIYEGKAKKIFQTEVQNQLLMEFKDSLTAFNAQKKGEFVGKGQLNCKISTYLFKLLAQNEVPHHWIKTENDQRHMLVEKTRIIPLEVVVRNFLAGSLATKLNLPEGQKLKKPLVELYYKKDELNDPFVSDDQATEFGWVATHELSEMKSWALKINQILTDCFLRAGLKLVDFKIEFGVNAEGQIILADEISPDCMRLWDLKTNEKFDKDRFRRDLGQVAEAYQSVLTRLEGIPV